MGSLYDQVIRLGIKEGYGARWIEKLVPIIHGFPDNLPLEDMISMNSAFLWKTVHYSLQIPENQQFYGRTAIRVHNWCHFVDGPSSAKARMVPCREEDWLTAGQGIGKTLRA